MLAVAGILAVAATILLSCGSALPVYASLTGTSMVPGGGAGGVTLFSSHNKRHQALNEITSLAQDKKTSAKISEEPPVRIHIH